MGPILDENWQLKKQLVDARSPIIGSTPVTKRRNRAAPPAASCSGQGAAAFSCCTAKRQHQEKLRACLAELRDMKFAFDNFGTQVIYYEENKVW